MPSRKVPRSSPAASAPPLINIKLCGSFFAPTVLTELTTDMVITRKETSGPVARSTASRPKRTRSRWPTTPPP
jgi:hypothetical protein